MRELAPTLPLPVSAIAVHDGGPNGLPFTSHRLVQGVPVGELARPLAANAGAVLGHFLRATHAFPMERAVALGLAKASPQAHRESRKRFLERRVVPEVFPLISETARRHVSATFEAFLAEASNFEWEPVVSHSDIDAYNVLADPATGELTGVIDWGDLSLHDPAGDFVSAQFGTLARAGLQDQLPHLFHAYGLTRRERESMRPRCEFGAYSEPLHQIIYGIESDQEAFVRAGIDRLYETLKGRHLGP